MPQTEIDSIYENFSEIITILENSNALSSMNSAQENFRKILLLAAASFFESKIMTELDTYFSENIIDDSLCLQFVRNKAFIRQYHTYFDWDSPNCNKFFSLFGPEFKSYMSREISRDQQLKDSIHAFLELGRDRNRLIHGNYAVFPLEKTAEEIFRLYTQALVFVDTFPEKLRNNISNE